MKRCPFCAEEIQDAAIVCKHCGRDLVAQWTAASPSPPARPSRRYRVIAVVLVALVGLYFVINLFRADYLAFDAKRRDWHLRCDAYVGRQVADRDRLAAAACAREMTELAAYAATKGWTSSASESQDSRPAYNREVSAWRQACREFEGRSVVATVDERRFRACQEQKADLTTRAAALGVTAP